jgi:multiple sugar transport system substrate-binding protein
MTRDRKGIDMNPRISRRTATKGLLVVAASPWALAACSDDENQAPTEVSQDEIDEAMQTPTEITFWTWVPDIENEIALFEEAYPAITVNLVNAGQGADHYQQMRTALEAGQGAPDIAQIEFQMIQSFAITENLLDLRPYLSGGLSEQFVDWTWQQVTGPNGEIWAVPQDSGPMGMLYRVDFFDQFGIEVPETWDDFAAAAERLRSADPSKYLTNVAPNQAASFVGMLWQAGANPFEGSDGEVLKVDLQSDIATQVAQYWGDLAQRDLVSTDADFADQWYQAFNQGKYATWLTAAWGPVFLSSAAESTSGNWRAAVLPQWNAGDGISANWGGSTNAVMNASQKPIPAAKLAEFINTDAESTKKMATEQFLFPVTTALLEDPEFTGQELEFYGGQQVNELFAQISDTVPLGFTWSPFQDQVYADWEDTVGTALAEKADVVAAMAAWEDRIKTFAQNQGFTVE